MIDQIRLRRWIRVLCALCVGLATLAAAGWLRGRGAEDAAVTLRSAEDVDELRQRISAAGQAERIRLLHAMGRAGGAPATGVVIEMLGAARTDRERRVAIAQLGRLGTPAALDQLVELTRDGRPSLQQAAIEALGQARSAGAAQRLADLLREAAGPRRRGQLVRALGECGVDPAATTLAALCEDPREPARLEAIAALGRTGSADALEPLVALSRAGPLKLRRAAVRGLGELGAPSAKQALIRLVQSGPASLRGAAVEALAQYAGDDVQVVLAGVAAGGDARLANTALRALGDDDGPLARETVAAALRSERLETRQAAVRALGRSGDPEARETLIGLLEDPTLAKEAAAQLGGLDDPAAQTALLQVARADAPVALQRAALSALAGAPDSEALTQALGELVRGGNPDVAADALRQLAQRQGAGARELLLSSYRDGTPSTRQAALQALVGQDGAAARGLLREAARSSDSALAAMAVRELARLDGAESRALLTDLVGQGGGSSAYAAAQALADLGGDEARRALLEAFKGEGSQYHVKWALGGMRDAETQRQIAALLDDTQLSEYKKRQAVEMLKQGGDAERLLAAAGHPDKAVANAALGALGGIGGAAAERALLDAASSPDQQRRTAALAALGDLGTPKAVDALSQALRDEATFGAAAEKLAELGGKQALETLGGHYRAAAPEQRREIVGALARTKDPRGRALLVSALDDQDANVVRTAVGALSSGPVSPQIRQRLFSLMQSAPDSYTRRMIAYRLRNADQRFFRAHRAVFERVLSES